MSLASDDIWQKFDLAKSEFIKMEQEEMNTVTNNIYQMMKPTKSTDSLVPDIDMLAFPSNLDVDINMDGGIDMDFDSLLEDILGFQDKPLRHDCMWSGDMSTNEEKSLMLLNTNSEPKNKPDIAPSTNMNLGSITKDLDCFDTPLSSETSDLDETSSDIDGEVEVGTINSRLQGSRDTLKSNQDITYSDHCYIATSKRDIIKTREESSDDDDSNSSQHINPSNTFRIPNHPVRVSPIHTKPVNKPKFKFHMKFNSTSLQSSRSLLRRPRLQYPRQNGFKLPVLPNTSKTIQVSCNLSPKFSHLFLVRGVKWFIFIISFLAFESFGGSKVFLLKLHFHLFSPPLPQPGFAFFLSCIKN